jgi:hypothetical protein
MEFLADTYESSDESVCLLIQIWDIKITDTNLLIFAKLRCNNMFYVTQPEYFPVLSSTNTNMTVVQTRELRTMLAANY